MLPETLHEHSGPFPPARQRRVLVLGASGTIGRATVAALHARGHAVVCVLRPESDAAGLPAGVEIRRAEVTDPASLGQHGFAGDRFDALVSCLASRSGIPADAWAVDHGANLAALNLARRAGVGHFVLLSAICVQRPMLAFQHAKLAFEAELAASGVDYSIVRPTAYFKSLSGQIGRLRRGRPFLVFGDGRLTACKPISDRDLAAFIADCLDDPLRRNRILPIGGPGPALSPREQGALLFAALGRPARFRSVPVGVLDAIVFALSLLGRLDRRMAAKAELARIGRYYATQSMLALDPATGRYEPSLTPETGSDTLADHYRRLARDGATDDLGAHAVF